MKGGAALQEDLAFREIPLLLPACLLLTQLPSMKPLLATATWSAVMAEDFISTQAGGKDRLQKPLSAEAQAHFLSATSSLQLTKHSSGPLVPFLRSQIRSESFSLPLLVFKPSETHAHLFGRMRILETQWKLELGNMVPGQSYSLAAVSGAILAWLCRKELMTPATRLGSFMWT